MVKSRIVNATETKTAIGSRNPTNRDEQVAETGTFISDTTYVLSWRKTKPLLENLTPDRMATAHGATNSDTTAQLVL